MQNLHTQRMQSDWFRERMAACGVGEDAVGECIRRDRSTANRLINGERQLRFDEIEALAGLLNVTVLEMLRRAYDWKDPALVAIAENWATSSPSERRRLVRMIRARAHADDEEE